jgi:hypothetical protein
MSMQTILQSVLWAPSLRVKRWEREADNSFPSTAKVKKYVLLYLSNYVLFN